MNAIIKDDTVICNETGESISITSLNKGLSDFYKMPVSISENNIKEFEGDILALCFGFDN